MLENKKISIDKTKNTEMTHIKKPLPGHGK